MMDVFSENKRNLLKVCQGFKDASTRTFEFEWNRSDKSCSSRSTGDRKCEKTGHKSGEGKRNMFVKKSIPRESLKIPDYPKRLRNPFFGVGGRHTPNFFSTKRSRGTFSRPKPCSPNPRTSSDCTECRGGRLGGAQPWATPRRPQVRAAKDLHIIHLTRGRPRPAPPPALSHTPSSRALAAPILCSPLPLPPRATHVRARARSRRGDSATPRRLRPRGFRALGGARRIVWELGAGICGAREAGSVLQRLTERLGRAREHCARPRPALSRASCMHARMNARTRACTHTRSPFLTCHGPVVLSAAAGAPDAGADAMEPEGEAVVYEEELLQNPYSMKLWIRYLQIKAEAQILKSTLSSDSYVVKVLGH